jgi:hypothetical protein
LRPTKVKKAPSPRQICSLFVWYAGKTAKTAGVNPPFLTFIKLIVHYTTRASLICFKELKETVGNIQILLQNV